MRVLIRDALTGEYFRGGAEWVGSPLAAVDFRTLEVAGRQAVRCDREEVDVVLQYEDPECELAINPAYCVPPAWRENGSRPGI